MQYQPLLLCVRLHLQQVANNGFYTYCFTSIFVGFNIVIICIIRLCFPNRAVRILIALGQSFVSLKAAVTFSCVILSSDIM